MARKQLLVQIERDWDDMDQVVDALQKEGMTVDRVMKITRTITGHMEAPNLNRIGAMGGVANVREEGTFQLPPNRPGVPQ